MASTFALAAQLAPASPAIQAVSADTPAPKAVFIVGPAGEAMTKSNLVDAAHMADQAEAVGMDVRRVFYPDSTWDNVLANVQGASLVVYMGHGYGWPSPYTAKLTESRQDGMGLVDPANPPGYSTYKYYGATLIKDNIHLAPNAVAVLVHGCYTAGNGEPGMAIPSEDLARQRVDNFASGFLAAGAHAVFAFGWNQKLNYPSALMNTNMTMDQMFMSTGDGSPWAFVGWQDKRFESQRTPGAMNHLDPHPKEGYYRAVTGDLGMTAADWRAGAAGNPPPPPPPPSDPGTPPEITSLTAGDAATPPQAAAPDTAPASFHPNGDGLDDELHLQHTVTRAAYLDAVVTNAAGETVRTYSVWSTTGTSASSWDGKNVAGSVVADGTYTLTYTPRDVNGITGTPVAASAVVLTAIALANPTKTALLASDGDSLSRNTTFNVTLNQPAQLTWLIVNDAGDTVQTVETNAQVAAGAQSFVWDGKASNGAWVPDGYYRSVVSAQTGLGSYSQERQVFVGAFQANPSTSSPARGGKITLTLVSSETLKKNPTVQVTQPGIAAWTVTTKHLSGNQYRVTITLKGSGTDGTVAFKISGIDSKGGHQATTVTLPLS